MTHILTLLDISAVQQYLFSSNRLRHALAASWLVKQASSEWVKRAADDAGGTVIYAGGGNAALTFVSLEGARAFARDYTKQLIEQAPGLRVAIRHTLYQTGKLANTFDAAGKQLAQQKLAQPISLPQPGISVTAACDYTGLPAVQREKNKHTLLSAELAAKERVVDESRAGLIEDLGDSIRGYSPITDFNLLGEHGNASFMAVIHADGNGMGKRKRELVQGHLNNSDDEAFVNALALFSDQVVTATTDALQKTVSQLLGWLNDAGKQERKARYAPIAADGTRDLMFVPIVTGGDDITLVTDGRLGLSVAAFFLKTLAEHGRVQNSPVYACAGVAITGNRAPFARAYKLSEALCKNAKQALTSKNLEGSALDWHIAMSNLDEGIFGLRQREYTVASGELAQRPVVVGTTTPKSPAYINYDRFRALITDFADGPNWYDRRNKVKALRDILRNGGEAVENYRNALDLPEFSLLDDGTARQNGWSGTQCLVFDAIEAIDIFEDIELQPELEGTRG
jgi:hypothetical protein